MLYMQVLNGLSGAGQRCHTVHHEMNGSRTRSTITMIRNCNLCQEPQEVTPLAIDAWEDVIVLRNCKSLIDFNNPCLCVDCYWDIKDPQ